jgi:hypothetical protein
MPRNIPALEDFECELLPDNQTVVMRIESIDKNKVEVKLTNDHASQLVSAILSVVGLAPASPIQPGQPLEVRAPQLIPLTQIGFGQDTATGETVLSVSVGSLKLVFLVGDPRALIEMSKMILSQADDLLQPLTVKRQ